MDTKPLEKFAQAARRQLHEQVKARLAQVLQTDSPELRAKASVVAELNKQIAQSSRQAVIERVAYTWFNRFCALRYMDANRYTRLGIVSPAPGNTQPEILQEAKAGHIDEELAKFVDGQRVFDLLSGRLASPDGQGEAYRLLLVGSCNQYHAVMPFLFEKIDDYTELLMPDDLLSTSSVLAAAREVLTEEVCQDVEVIGWLYQFYISEKKDAVIGAKKAITPENIPAATQLFTPNWIVRYLVQNSLGRLWLLNRPHSRLAAQMEFYIAPDEKSDFSEKSDFLRINSPEELTVCDPAVGSAHMLTYAFELLYAIYEEEGYSPPDIPRLILQHNLVGLEIDERAAALAAFALVMKARAKDRRFFKRGVSPAITTLRPIQFSEAELDAEVEALAPALTDSLEDEPKTERKQRVASRLREALRHDLTLFKEADNFGSLLRPMLSARQLRQLHDHLNRAAPTGQLQLFDQERRRKVRQAIAQALPLARHYAVVVANPPYMGNKNQNAVLKQFLNNGYKDVKADLFSAFTVRIMEMTRKAGFIGMMTPFNWMFLSSFEKMRQIILDDYTLTNLVRPEFHAFFDSAYVTICGFTLFNGSLPDYKGSFIDLQDFYGADKQPVKALEAIKNPNCAYLYHASATHFKKIPGSPIAYWVSQEIVTVFSNSRPLRDFAKPVVGLQTGDNSRFIRLWHEVSNDNIGIGFQYTLDAKESLMKWFPYNKGGEFRKWYGNHEYVVNWFNDGHEIKHFVDDQGKLRSRPQNTQYYFQPSLTYTATSSSYFGVRYSDTGFLFDVKGSSCFSPEKYLHSILGFLASKLVSRLLSALNPTIEFQTGNISDLPFKQDLLQEVNIKNIVSKLINTSRNDWDSYETSWNFDFLPLLQTIQWQDSLATIYAAMRQQWHAATLEMQRLEEENNRLFIAAYGLQDELTSDVPLSEITLTCNPHYRYSGNKSEEELEALLLADTMREFISYAVSCMFGRYSLDKPGLILANQGETADDYRRIVNGELGMVNGELSYPPDEDNAIPMLDGDWFSDDITERFKKFLRVTFGEEHYAENLAFIEAALGRDIRNYFLRDFYDHHVKMYKKRPIYWLFSSPKGSFNVLIYMHRYRPDTVSVVLNDYLREFRAKLEARKGLLEGVSASAGSSPRDKTRALKEISDIDKTLKEIRDYEDDVLYPLATRQVQIDLDDGVLVNYNKFGPALKKVTGLSES